MPRFFFNVRNGWGGLADPDGTSLPDVQSAKDYARRLARELMHGHETKRRYWHVVVRDDEDNRVFDLPFFSVDDSMNHLNPDRRRLIEIMCEKRMALAETLFETRMNVLRVRATLARSRNRPYVAAERGHAVLPQTKRKA
jgi:hypothetical protein